MINLREVPSGSVAYERVRYSVTAYTGQKSHDDWGALGPRVLLNEAPWDLVAAMGEAFLDERKAWFSWWNSVLDKSQASYRTRPKFYGFPPGFHETWRHRILATASTVEPGTEFHLGDAAIEAPSPRRRHRRG